MREKVVFRKFENGEILALFPEMKADTNSELCGSYMRIGQHDASHYDHCLKITKTAKASEYRALKLELEDRGYILKVSKPNERKVK